MQSKIATAAAEP